MDTHRGDQHGNSPDSHDYRHPRGPSRFSDSPMNNHHRRIPNSYGGGGPGGGGRDCRPFDSPPRYPPSDVGGFRPMGGGARGAGGFSTDHHMLPLSGHKRGHPFSGGGASPVRFNGGSFAKLFVGSVPRTATEDGIRPLFEEHGCVLEVALIKDRKTGHQQGCCFIKYATSEEADRAIRALHNQHTLPGGVGPIQVRYADGERERLGAAEYKLFVGSLNKQATEKEVEEIFSTYGRVEDVYLMRDDMKQSRGCGFVKFSQRETALTAINALNGIYIMRGCDQPLIVRFADPKKPRLDESRGGPALGGHGFGPRFQAPGIRRPPNLGEPMCSSVPPNAWHPMSSQDLGPASNAGIQSFGNQLLPRSGEMGGPLGGFSGSSDSLSRFAVSSALVPQQNFNPSLLQAPPMGQQISPLQKPLQSPQEMPSSLQLQSQAHASFSQTQTSHASIRQPSQPPLLLSAGQTPFRQALPSQQLLGLGGQSSVSRPQVQQNALSATAQSPLNNNAQPHFLSPLANQQQLPGQQQLLQPLHQSPSQLAQMLSHQTQTLQASFQSSQQAFSQLQQQLQLMQPSSQGLTAQQGSQASKQQSSWVGVPQSDVSTSAIPSTDVPSAGSDALAVPAMNQSLVPMKCNWTEHTSPDGFKYYYNITTGESRWEKPHEMMLYEQKQQQKQSIQQRQSHPLPQSLSAQHFHHTQVQIQSQLQTQLQTQLRHSQQLQQIPQSSSASGVAGHQNIQEVGLTQLPIATSSVNDHSLLQQGLQADQEWMWKNNPAGT